MRPGRAELAFLAVLGCACRLCEGGSKEVLAHIQCQVCELAVEEARGYARNNSISEEDGLTDLVENLCSSTKKEGRWLLRLDIALDGPEPAGASALVSRLMSWLGISGSGRLASWLGISGSRKAAASLASDHENATLVVVRRAQAGECQKECTMLHKACKQALRGKEETLVSMLAQSKGVASTREKTCRKTCEKRKKLPKLGKWVDEEFVPKDEKDFELDDMMAKMKAETGMGMKMYKREDMLAMSEGDMETMAAREAFAQERQASKMSQDL